MAAQHSRYGDYSTRYRFNGKEQDQATGFYYYGARYYAPSLSRWLSTDPLAEKYQGFSPYNYTLNNPVMLVDPDGMRVKKGEDWIRKKGTKTWKWDDSVNGKKDVKKGYEYGGKTKGEVRKNYEHWYSFLGFFREEFDDDGRFSNFIKDVIEQNRLQLSSATTLTEAQKKKNTEIYYNHLDNRMSETISPTYNFCIDKMPEQEDINFKFTAVIGGRKIVANGGYIKRNPKINYIDRIGLGDIDRTVMDGFGRYSVLFGNNKGVILTISTNKEDGEFIINYIKHGK